MTPYLVLNVHWARLLICPSKRRRENGGMKVGREGEEEKIDGRGRKENVQGKKMGVMEKGEKQRQNTFTPQIEKKVTRSKTQRS